MSTLFYLRIEHYSAIAKQLKAEGIPTPTGLEKWQLATVRNILTNETYRGSKRMQKTYCTNYLTKAKKENEGELPMYYIEESHDAIIPPDEWDAVQAEIARRKELGRPMSCQSPFSTKIKCGDCEAWFGSKVWGSNTKYRRTIWRCNDRYNKRGKRDCETSHVNENEVKFRFLAAFNKLMTNRDNLIEDCRLVQKALCDTASIDTEIAELEKEALLVEGLSRQAISENARQPIDQSEWTKRNGVYLNRHANATKRLEELDKLRTERVGKSKALELFIRQISKTDQVLTDFDESLWAAVIEYVSIEVDGSMTFRFKNGAEVLV